MEIWRFLRKSTTFAIFAALFFLPSGLTAQQQTVRAGQGELARWGGEGTISCGMDGRTFKPVDGTCWYPINFARSPGTVEIARWTTSGMETAWLIVEKKEYETQDIDFPDTSYVDVSSEDLERHYQQQAKIKPFFRKRSGEPRFSIPLAEPASQPLPEGRYFAVHRTFNGEPKNRHTGIDYAIGLDNPVKAVADGTVFLAEEHFFAGKSVYLYHGDGLVSMYFHLNDYKVEAGQEVKRGDEIALIGSTGRSTGPHLHLGLRWRGARIDPNLLIGDVDQVPSVE